MDANIFDEIAKLFAARRLSRRQALARGGAGLAAGALATIGLGAPAAATSAGPSTGDRRPADTLAASMPAATDSFAVLAEPAAGATAVATPSATGAKEITFLFLQSFERGSLAPKPGSPGRYTLTLRQGLGDTVYFSDRPAKIVGTVPTAQFLKGLGFTPANPPNAALVGQRDATHKDVVVVELYDPHYDAASNTLTYEVTLLKDWHKLDETFQQTPDDEQHLPRDFTAAHLFIDDCADRLIGCYPASGPPGYGHLPGYRGMCWDWNQFQCVPCVGLSALSRECNDYFLMCQIRQTCQAQVCYEASACS